MRNAKAGYGYKNRGSIILLVIGLLTILAMLGTTLLLIARMDQRTSRAVASAAPSLETANSVLDQLRADRAADLHIDINGVYGGIGGNPQLAIDYPSDDVDRALANIERQTTGEWLHITNLTGLTNLNYQNQAPGNLDVDTDGDGTNDARLFNTTTQDREGKLFQAAVRMIDAGGLMNINTANTTWGATGNVMDATYVSLDQFLIDAGFPGLLGNVITGQLGVPGRPYDFSDLMALACDPDIDPNSGRAYVNLGGAYAATRKYLTTLSKTTLAAPAYGGFTTPNGRKVDLNTALPNDIYNAFRAMLNAANWSGPVNAFADQLTANVLSFRTPGNIPQLGPLGSIGIERQPFITKIFCRLQRSTTPEDDSQITQVSAIELFNPYDELLRLDDYYLLDGLNNLVGAFGDFGGKWIPAQGHFVLQSVNSMRLATLPPPGFQGQQQLNLPVLDVFRGNLPLRLMRRPAAGIDVCIDSVPGGPGGFAPAFPPVVSQAYSTTTWRRDEDPANARYTVAAYEIHLNDDTYNYYAPDGLLATGDLGVRDMRPAAGISAASCPIYVRNGPFINVGELMRLLMVGPTVNVSVPDRLAALPVAELTSWSSARLDPNGSIFNGAAVRVPPACLIGEYFTVLTTTPVDGLVNINTAPRKVLECLPAIAQLAVADDRTRVVNEIMAYRDYITYGSGPPTGSSVYGTDSRAKVTKIESPATPIELRSDRNLDLGFATSGEIAIPIRQALPSAVSGHPGAAPGNYALGLGTMGVDDDGFFITGSAPTGDLDKYNVHYKWLSNQVTVRSDTYIAYILVRPPGGNVNGSQDRRFVALIDRSNCAAAGDLPKVLMMAEVK